MKQFTQHYIIRLVSVRELALPPSGIRMHGPEAVYVYDIV